MKLPLWSPLLMKARKRTRPLRPARSGGAFTSQSAHSGDAPWQHHGLGPLKRPFEREKPGRRGGRFHGRLPPPSGNVEHLPHHRAHLGDLSGSRQPKRSRQCSSSRSTRAKYDTLSMTHTLPVTVSVCLSSRPAANWQTSSSLFSGVELAGNSLSRLRIRGYRAGFIQAWIFLSC